MPRGNRDRRPIIWVPVKGVVDIMSLPSDSGGPCDGGRAQLLRLCGVEKMGDLTAARLLQALVVADAQVWATDVEWFLNRLARMGGHVGSAATETWPWKTPLRIAACRGWSYEIYWKLCANAATKYRIFFYEDKKIKPKVLPATGEAEAGADGS